MIEMSSITQRMTDCIHVSHRAGLGVVAFTACLREPEMFIRAFRLRAVAERDAEDFLLPLRKDGQNLMRLAIRSDDTVADMDGSHFDKSCRRQNLCVKRLCFAYPF